MQNHHRILAFFMICAMTSEAYCRDHSKHREFKERKGKKVEIDGDGNVAVTLSRKKWSNEKGRFLCCPLAAKHCQAPCNGLSCDARCTLTCGLFSFFSCAPLTCQTANSAGCLSATTGTCPTGWTTSGSLCYKLSTTDMDWLAALLDCVGQGGTLAKVESAADNTLVQGLLGN